MPRKSNNVYKPKMTAFLVATIMLVLVVIVILMSTILILSVGGNGDATTTASTPRTPSQTTPAITTSGAPDVTTTPPTTTTKTPDVPDTPNVPVADTVMMNKNQTGIGSLVLVDNSHFYTREGLKRHKDMSATEAGLLGMSAMSGSTGNYVLQALPRYLDSDALAAFNEMMGDVAAIFTNGKVQVDSAYYYDAGVKAITDQASLEAVEHSTGLVLDLKLNVDGKIYPLNHPSFKSSFYDWLVENCWKYGFIHLRDVSDSSLGYYSSFRYVGIPHAAALKKDAQLTFSTYLTVLTAYNFDNRMKVTDANGAEWWIYYVKAESDTVAIPVLGDESVYQISGDNQGGFIVAIDSSKFAK